MRKNLALLSLLGLVVVVVALIGVKSWASAAAASSPWGGGEDGDLTVPASSTYDISQDNHPGRSCVDGGDAVVYQVTGFTDTTATVNTPPQPGCLAPGDEVMLIKLQGSYTDNVGVYEFLEVANVSGNTVTFASAKTHTYGNAASSDSGVNSTEHVMLQRVPHYGTLNVLGTMTTRPWDGAVGGVIVFRAQTVTGSGTIKVAGLGYRGGQGGQVYLDKGQQGESISGQGVRSRAANIGGGGGGLDGGGGSACSTCAHLYGAGGNYAGGATGDGFGDGLAGEEYGTVTLSQIYMGSGGGGGGFDGGGGRGGNGGAGGGVVIGYAHTWTLTGSVVADGAEGSEGASSRRPNHGGPGSGGSIHVVGDRVAIGSLYARGEDGAAPYMGGAGRIVVEYASAMDVGEAAPDPYVVALPTPTPTATFTPSPTATFTPSPTATFTNTPTATSTPTPMPTSSPTPTQAFWTTATAVSLTATALAPTSTPIPQTPSNGGNDDDGQGSGSGSSAGSGNEAAATPAPPASEAYTPYVPPAPYGYFTVVVRVFADANRDNVMSLQESVSGVPVYAFDAMFHRIGAVLTHKGIATFQVPVMPGQMYYFDLPYLGLTAFVNSPRDATQTQPLFVDFRLEAPIQPVMLP